MDFIELTKPEYSRMVGKLVWTIPFVRFWKIFGPLSAVMIYLDIIYNITHQASGGIALWIILVVNICFLICIPFRILRYSEMHRAFVAKVKQLGRLEHEELLAEYPNWKKIDIYKNKKRIDGKRKRSNTLTIYITENFLFMPGLLLVHREELAEIKLILQKTKYTSSSPHYMGKSKIYFVKKAEASHTKPSGITGAIHSDWLAELESRSVRLPLKYSYDKSPETAEQIMAWFWQYDPNDPALPEKTKSHLTEFYEPPKLADKPKYSVSPQTIAIIVGAVIIIPLLVFVIVVVILDTMNLL